MSKLVIRVENLSKRYGLGERLPYHTLREAIVRSFTSQKKRLSSPGYIWALKDVSFEVNEGEIIGIIGCNGAGKTTLLKILSRITEPTEGLAEIHGRLSSLLEVGTGFHPELTGRENVFLNGAILGMRKWEIEKKFEEIVAFAEIEKFIDTPLKRYSSGMYVRLAFAVAAHLQPDILLLDEILAVGDLAFQKKCFQKIGEVAQGGQTILLVSHNLQAIGSLCSRAVCLENGRIIFSGKTQEVINSYLKQIEFLKDNEDISGARRALKSDSLNFVKLIILNARGQKTRTIHFREGFEVNLVFEVLKPIEDVRIGVTIWSPNGLGLATTHHTDGGLKPLKLKEGLYNISAQLENPLIPGYYILSVGAHDLKTSRGLDFIPEATAFTVLAYSEGETHHHDPYNRSFTYLPAAWKEAGAL